MNRNERKLALLCATKLIMMFHEEYIMELLLLFCICFSLTYNCTCSNTDPTCYLTHLQCTEDGKTSPRIDPEMPNASQGSHGSTDL